MLKWSCSPWKTTATISTIALMQLGAASAGAENLWIADDKTRTIYQVTLDGELIASFPQRKGASSGIDVDPRDGSLWGADDAPSRIVNFTRTGELIAYFSGDVFGAYGSEGVAVDGDGSLWVVDDPSASDGAPAAVLNITRTGEIIAGFETAVFDAAAKSPQAIAVDPFDATLWITDNKTSTVYNVSTEGRLLAAIPSHAFDANALNLQGISVDGRDGSLWMTARDTSTIYHMDRSGRLIASFPSSSFDVNSFDPTGIAYDGKREKPPGDSPGLRTQLEGLAEELRGLGRVDDHFKKAAEKLGKALDPEWWVTEDSLTKRGKPVFEEMGKAAEELLKVEREADTADDYIDQVVDVAAGLAKLAIGEAIAADGDPGKIESAMRKLESGLRYAAKREVKTAFEKLKKAWRYALQAMG